MGAEPAEVKVLRSDRIYTYDEFAELRTRYSSGRKRLKILNFHKRHRIVPFVLHVSYQTAIATGVVLLLGTVLAYGMLATALTNKNYKLMDTKRSLHNLNLALTAEKTDNKQAEDKLVYGKDAAKGLGLVPPADTKFIVRTNIKPGRKNAKNVKDLYPLSDEVIKIDP
jgi:hypothetical protein